MSLKRQLISKNIFIFGFLAILPLLCILHPVQAPYTVDGEKVSSLSSIQLNPPSNITFTSNKVNFDFTVESFIDARAIKRTFTYSLDGKDNVTVSNRIDNIANPSEANGNKIIDLITGSINLRNLQQGDHSLTIFATYVIEQEQTVSFDSKTVYFTIDAKSSNASSGNYLLEILTDYVYLFVIVTVMLVIFVFCIWKLKARSHRAQLTT